MLIAESPAPVPGEDAFFGLRAIAVLPVVGLGVWATEIGNRTPVCQSTVSTGLDPARCVIMLSRASILYCQEASRDKRFLRVVAVVKL